METIEECLLHIILWEWLQENISLGDDIVETGTYFDRGKHSIPISLHLNGVYIELGEMFVPYRFSVEDELLWMSLKRQLMPTE